MNIAVNKTPAELAYDGMLLPHPRLEDWKWTNLRVLIDRPYPPRVKVEAAKKDVERLLKRDPLAKLAHARIVFVNGEFAEGYSNLPAGGDVRVKAHLNGLDADSEPVLDMNLAFATAGVEIEITTNIDAPVEIVHVATDAEARTIATRNKVKVADGASATLFETHIGEGDYLSNSVIDIVLGAGAKLDRVKLEIESRSAIHLAHALITIGANTVLRDFTLTSGARVNRQNGTLEFKGERADAKIAGSYLLAGKQHADTRLVIDHQVPKCTSRELFKCVMDENARGIFQGKAIVRPDAQKTDGKQSSHALLLSETAEFDAKPELEIYADDVACGHGATSGDIDHNHLFYLQSRGIPEAEAKSMLIGAFVGEAFDTIGHDGVRDVLTRFAESWLVNHKEDAR
ncbi:Fe-S cluster assembly protein SufD [Nordella sp. HKS 07]|uniref:Fe-S cluster assembly protein SufD n=1 Tax=Nordella sp. HKS 07 TaxID=2712222 RepID=UPI0013E12A25|nr:Fe-S cluster assembly protein SufD [Nordella sp. HKS 07]QIG50774.1 Fe-S cluster assembly protein SufD [Nordella sp. HKS 07]